MTKTPTELLALPGAEQALQLLKLMADDTRWQLIGALRQSDRQAGELAAELQLPQNLISYHLGVLRQAGLVQVHRSEADARVMYYSLELLALQQGYSQIGAALALSATAPSAVAATSVAFLCTHNSARSQIAEGWLRQLSGGRVAVRSAGTTPSALNPLAVQVMAEVGIDIAYQQAKPIDTLASFAPAVVVTVCDLAREQCPPVAPGVVQLHWSIRDPAAASGDQAARLAVFRATREQLRVRVAGLLAALPQA